MRRLRRWRSSWGSAKATGGRASPQARPAPQEPLSENERSELTRLRRENLQLQMERDIFKKATAFFARQSE